jgi:hypothetical protein
MRHSLYKYYSTRKWADAFLDGKLRFNSLAYFRDFEDVQARGDKNEGKMIFRPEDGLVITNQTQGWTRTIPRALNATVKQEEIFVFCMSKSFTEELRERFEAVACVEILNVRAFCEKIESALPAKTTFPGKPGRERIGQAVTYYEETDDCNPTWACPDMIAALKSKPFAWQHEYRLIFSLTNALAFENAQYALVRDGTSQEQKRAEHQPYDLNAGSLRDICRLHVFETEVATTVSAVSTQLVRS